MLNGTTEKEFFIIKEILSDYPYDFYAYGSRTKNDFNALSDLDLFVSGNITLEEINTIKSRFDNSLLPYVFNLSVNVDDKFYNLIKDDLIKI